VSLLEGPLISLQDASYVTVRGLVLEAARGNGLTIDGGEHNTVAGCTFGLLGDYGLQVRGGRDHRVISCDISHTGDGGVSLAGGDRKTLSPAGHAVLNCHFHHQGRWSKCYVPAVLASGVGIRIANNLIHDHPHCAILYSGNDHCIEYNEIHHIALETGDVGAIYSGRDWTYRGNVIRGNFIHETGGVGMGSMGVYMDDCVSGTEIVGNVFYRVTRAAFLGGGRDHRVINNVFVECSPAVQVDGRGLDTSPVWHTMVADFMKKRLADVPAELYRARYPALGDLDKFYRSDARFPPEGNVIARNVCVGGKWLSVGWHATESMLEIKDNYLGQLSDLVNPGGMDFRPKPDCPALASGFEPIATDRIGLQADPYRRRLPDGTLGLVS
ncbi:MAG: right-handed parallel beta-helix repeat-containing protein, partial [Sedimentisphaerales bacterium]|nr:right-handed parallel beta-helix repeat-containing protein [Sedimentisphaerales bacterium]